jgi:Tol biopolymer transport system component
MFRTQTPDGKLALGVCQLPDCTGLRTFPDPGRLPQWAPDSRRVAYVPYPPGPQGDIWIRPLEGGPAERVTNFDEWTVTGFGWSKSGKHLAVARSSRTSDVVSLSLPKPE